MRELEGREVAVLLMDTQAFGGVMLLKSSYLEICHWGFSVVATKNKNHIPYLEDHPR